MLQRSKTVDLAISGVLATCAYLSIAIKLTIIGILLYESWEFFRFVSLSEFFLDSVWAPLFEPRSFGIWPLVCGTFLVAGLSLIVAGPVGLLVAIFLSEYAPPALRSVLKPTLELLAGVPSVVFGFFALTTITPWLQKFIPQLEVFNALSAGIVVGIMTLPLVASLGDDALRFVPRAMKEGAYAVGATRFEVIRSVSVPAAASGICAAFVLAFARAIGETMAVTMASGSTPHLSLNPLQSTQTMTAYIAQVSMGDTPNGTIEYQSIFVVGFVLFCMTLTTNFFARWVVKNLRIEVRT